MTPTTSAPQWRTIQSKRDAILELAAQNGISHVRVFGSVVSGQTNPQSDVDLLVDGLENAPWGGGRFLMDVQALLGCPVDVVSMDDLHPLMRESVLQEAVEL